MQPNDFLADVPDTTDPQQPVPHLRKSELTTPHTVGQSNAGKPLMQLASSIEYRRGNVIDDAATIYLLIDEVTPANDAVDPILTQAYLALTKAAQLLQEARMHVYRYANRLDVLEQYHAELFAGQGPIEQFAARPKTIEVGRALDQ